MLSYRFRGLRLSESGDGFHGPIAVYIGDVKWRMTDELHISSGMFGRDALLRLDE